MTTATSEYLNQRVREWAEADQQNHEKWLRRNINSISGAIGNLEDLMLGHHFSGITALEVEALAKRLSNLIAPDKGFLKHGAMAKPVEIDRG